MKYKSIRLGDYIERSTKNNKDERYGTELIVGVSNEGVFTSPKGNPEGVDLKPYKIVNDGAFVYNPSRLDLGSIAYRTEGMCIVSHLYIVFYLNDEGKKIIDPTYLFMYFRRQEFYREVRFRNFGSQRPEFNFNDMSEIIMPLPPLPVQQKYVAIYKAMIANQQSYERGLEDLKLVCDAYIDKIERSRYVKLGKYIQRNQKKNQEIRFSKADVKGINTNGYFIKPMRLFAGYIATFKIIGYNDFVYNSRINSTINRLSIALNEGEDLIVTPAYETFYIENPNLLHPFYLYMLLQRDRFARTVLFNSFGSSTVFFGFDDLSDIEIPVIDVEEQKAISNVYRLYKNRHEINERLKAQIKDLCPILIKGAVEEGKKT